MKAQTAPKPQRKMQILPYIIATAVILSLPLIAMQFSDEVQWDETDFIVIGVLLLSAGLLFEFVSTKLTSKKHRIIAAAVALIGVMYLWAELAVGIFTNWGS